MYTIQYFISKFESVPDEKWAVGTLRKITESGMTRCAQGLCGLLDTKELTSIDPIQSIENVPHYQREGWALRKIFKDAGLHVAAVNNAPTDKYKQLTPKARILAALRDIQASEKPKLETTRVVHVVVEKGITPKEVVLN